MTSRIKLTTLSLTALLLTSCAGTKSPELTCVGAEAAPSRLFLQQVTASSAIIRWRGAADSICLGTDPAALDTPLQASAVEGHKEVQATGLEPDTVYYYSVGGARLAATGRQFRTAPPTGETPADGNIHIWLLGDSGTATEQSRGKFSHPGEAEQVKQGFLKYNREQADSEPLDLLLLLGDNAYLEGTDEQWQGAFFELYPEIIASTSTWPTIGNHEMGRGILDLCLLTSLPQCEKGPVRLPLGGVSESAEPDSYDSDGKGPDGTGLPYLSIFNLPSRGEAGGAASGTEQYYSFDYGNLHVISLDSQLSNRDDAQRSTMRSWLISDLESNDLDWTVVIFHHPPYSRGENHDSDLEQAEIDMRTSFAPVFEDYGVDAIYSGHAHSYERSWYLHGHHGLSATFDSAAHAELNADGKPALGQNGERYRQISPSSGADDRAVYTVAGSSGKADKLSPCPKGRQFGCTTEDWLTHPAHRDFDAGIDGARPNGLARRGSVVLDVSGNTLRSRFVDEHGEVLDHFVIER